MFTQTLIITQLSGIFLLKNSMRRIEKIQERYLPIILYDYESNYDALLNKSGKSTFEVKSLRTLAIEIFKPLNNENPTFMRELF